MFHVDREGGPNMNVLGLMGQAGSNCHDGSAALVRDGDLVVAVEQERLSRQKHAPGEPPDDAARACLDAVGLTLNDIDHLAYGWNECAPGNGSRVGEFICRSDAYTTDILRKDRWEYDEPPKIHFVDHHISHVMAVVGTERPTNAACLVADGRGESASTTLASYDGDVCVLERYPVAYSLGILFDAASYYAGLGEFGGGKLMGLSSFGTAGRTDWLSFDAETGDFDLPVPKCESSTGVFEAWIEFFEREFFPYRVGDDEDAAYYQDFAATIQTTLEEVVLSMAEYLDLLTESDTLVFGGGVALNSVLNRRLHRQSPFEETLLHPASNDAGVSVGAVYELLRTLDADLAAEPGSADPYVGPSPPDSPPTTGDAPDWQHLSMDRLVETVAADLLEERVVGWFRRETEFGPRALGHRSILGNPMTRETLYELNGLKGRAPWRPLAPSVLATQFENVFETDCSSDLARYMLTTATVSEEWRRRIPAVVHVDGTSRPQSVQESSTPVYHWLIESFAADTGVPLLVNTSFNLGGMPIVNRPSEALKMFYGTDQMDALVIGNHYLSPPP